MTLKSLSLAVAAAGILALANSPASAAPITGTALLDPPPINDLVQNVRMRVYIHRGHRYCFYFDGWHGPGWYRCGWAWRRGYGWGGVYGWNDWYYGPAVTRLGHRRYRGREHEFRRGDRGDRLDRGTRTLRSGTSTFRSGTSGPTVNSTTSAPHLRSRTTGRAPTLQQNGPAMQQNMRSSGSGGGQMAPGGHGHGGGNGGQRGNEH